MPLDLTYYGSKTFRVVILGCVVVSACATSGQDPSQRVTAGRLDDARAQISPPLGATVSTLDQQRLQDQPGGENRSIGTSLRQLPGVTLGSNGRLFVRGQ